MNINIKGSVNTMDFFSNVLEKFDKTMHVFNAFGCKLEHIEKNTTSRVIQIAKSDSDENLFSALLELKEDSANLHIALPLNKDVESAKMIYEMFIKLNNTIAKNEPNYKQSFIEFLEEPQKIVLISQIINYDYVTNCDTFVDNVFESLSSMIQLVLSLEATIIENINIQKQHMNAELDLSKRVEYMTSNPDYMLERLTEQKNEKSDGKIGCLSLIGVLVLLYVIILILANMGL